MAQLLSIISKTGSCGAWTVFVKHVWCVWHVRVNSPYSKATYSTGVLRTQPKKDERKIKPGWPQSFFSFTIFTSLGLQWLGAPYTYFRLKILLLPMHFSGLLALCISVVCRKVKLSLWQFSPDFCLMIEEFFWNSVQGILLYSQNFFPVFQN